MEYDPSSRALGCSFISEKSPSSSFLALAAAIVSLNCDIWMPSDPLQFANRMGRPELYKSNQPIDTDNSIA
jgi:hypothetical protein